MNYIKKIWIWWQQHVCKGLQLPTVCDRGEQLLHFNRGMLKCSSFNVPIRQSPLSDVGFELLRLPGSSLSGFGFTMLQMFWRFSIILLKYEGPPWKMSGWSRCCSKICIYLLALMEHFQMCQRCSCYLGVGDVNVWLSSLVRSLKRQHRIWHRNIWYPL